jgi:hypothetical protein
MSGNFFFLFLKVEVELHLLGVEFFCVLKKQETYFQETNNLNYERKYNL